jgi:hypothetical protein
MSSATSRGKMSASALKYALFVSLELLEGRLETQELLSAIMEAEISLLTLLSSSLKTNIYIAFQIKKYSAIMLHILRYIHRLI